MQSLLVPKQRQEKQTSQSQKRTQRRKKNGPSLWTFCHPARISTNASQTQHSRWRLEYDSFLNYLCLAVMERPLVPDSLPSSVSVALWVGHFPEAGCAEAGGPRLCFCSRSHVGRQNGGGWVRHRSVPETHDKVRNCWCSLITACLKEKEEYVRFNGCDLTGVLI